jgi:prephenate dehydratase
MSLPRNLVMGCLGGPNTFGGDAARQIMESFPEFDRMSYHHTAEDGFAFNEGNDAMCAPHQMARTGYHVGVTSYVADKGSNLYVIADVEHFYHCCLLVKPGARMEDVRVIRGHTGSITQSRPWLEKNLPNATIEIVHTSSHEAAREALASDGSIASVGTPGMAEEFGLEKAAEEIDEGSSALYWAISPHAFFHDQPDRVVITGRFGREGTAGQIGNAMAELGYTLMSTFSKSTTEKVFEYDYSLLFEGKAELGKIQEIVARFPAARLAGAYEVRS